MVAMMDILITCVAALLAGGLNSIAGGGTFLTFPALVYVGVPPIPANATSAVAVFPGYLSAAFGFASDLRSFDRKEMIVLVGLSIVGGLAGALLLLVTPPDVFRSVVPWLLLFATVLFAFDSRIRTWTAGDAGVPPAGKIGATLAVTTYGGYFNGGLGIVLLALFSGLGYRDLNLMNGLKNALSFILTTASVITFAVAGIVFWKFAIAMMFSAAAGGYIGAHIARRLPKRFARLFVIGVGFAMTAAFFARG